MRIKAPAMRIKGLVATHRSYTATCAAVAIGTLLVCAVRRGQDANWDQLGYHLGIPFLLLHGTFWDSLEPSGVTTYLNPVVLLPQYITIRVLPPLAVAITLGVAQAMAFVVAARICLRIAGPDPDGAGYVGAFLGFVLCLASPMALSEAGTTYVDLVTAIPVLLGYLLLLTRDDVAAPRHACLAAGLLLGLAAGLKLTNMTFVVGAPAFFLAGPTAPRRRVVGLIQLMLGAGIGFMAIAGWWHLLLWRRFHNPIFPYANSVFHSPDLAAESIRDTRWPPKSPWAIVRDPLYWLFGGSPAPGLMSPASETDPGDARFALVLAAAPAALAIARFRRPRGVALLVRPETGLLLACTIDYVTWLYVFSIHRYLLPVEIMCGAVLLVLTDWAATGRWRTRLLLVLVAVTLVRVHVASWPRLPWRDHWRGIASAPLVLQDRPLIFLTFQASAFVALSLPADARYVDFDCRGIDLCDPRDTPLTQQLRNDLNAQPAFSLYAVIPGGAPLPVGASATPNLAGLVTYGLRLGSHCQRLPLMGKTYLICNVLRSAHGG
jgi:hypothetical protein